MDVMDVMDWVAGVSLFCTALCVGLSKAAAGACTCTTPASLLFNPYSPVDVHWDCCVDELLILCE